MRSLLIATLFASVVAYTFYVSRTRRLDFHVYYDASIAVLQGRIDLYDEPNMDPSLSYRYPPVFAVLFAPFTLISVGNARLVWVGFIVAAFLSWAAVVFYYLRSREGPNLRVSVAVGISLLLVGTWSWDALRYNNAHFVVLALLLAAFVLAQRGKDVLPALLLAAAASIKLFPILLLPYFAIRRRWRLVILTSAFLIFLNLLPAAFVGITNNAYLLKEWYEHIVEENDVYRVHAPENISLKGVIDRVLAADVHEPKGTEDIKLASLGPGTIKLIYGLSAGSVFALTMFLIAYYHSRQIGDEFSLHMFGLVLCMMVVVGPRTNDYFLGAMLIPLALMILCCFRSPTKFNLGLLAAVVLTSAAHILMPGKDRRNLMTLAGWHLLLPVLLGIGIAANLYRATRPIRRLTGTENGQLDPIPVDIKPAIL